MQKGFNNQTILLPTLSLCKPKSKSAAVEDPRCRTCLATIVAVIVYVYRDSPALSSSAMHVDRARLAASAAVRSSPPVPLPLGVLLLRRRCSAAAPTIHRESRRISPLPPHFSRQWPLTRLRGPVFHRLRDPLCRRRCSSPRSSAAAARASLLRRRCSPPLSSAAVSRARLLRIRCSPLTPP
ncbi:hypothetical protein Syun_012941 [Stephania yunnanensis]|uniref:Uncharacterized protein n=1 Tax=Stephania yunnanensis TaxID=152371 RepID=A0AAP0K0G0_9MAGN